MKSGNPHVDKDAFNPLLVSRLRSARAALSKAKINFKALPATFVREQTRLITCSLTIVQKTKAAKRARQKAAKAAAQKDKTSETPVVKEFVPSTSSEHTETPPTKTSFASETTDVPKFSTAWFMRNRAIFQALIDLQISESAYDSTGRNAPTYSQAAIDLLTPSLPLVFETLAYLELVRVKDRSLSFTESKHLIVHDKDQPEHPPALALLLKQVHSFASLSLLPALSEL